MNSQAQKVGVWFRYARRAVYALASGFLALKIEGVEQIPQQGGAIIAGNHPSVLDGILLLAIAPRPVRFLVAEDLYNHRHLHRWFKMLGCIPVYRTKTHNGDALHAAVAALAAGDLIGIFPEGTIHDRGAMRQMKRGVALLALKTGCPVVPLAIHGTFESFPSGARMPCPYPVQMRFEAPVTYQQTFADPIPEEQVAAVLEEVRMRILKTLQMLTPQRLERREEGWFKRLQVALAGVIVCPLAGFLTLTANPSLDPVKKSRLA